MKTLLVCSVLMFTFGLGYVASHMLVPPVHAAAGAQRWENICQYDDSLDDINDYVKRMGAEGWELAGAGLGQTFFVCFKRPLG
jgi:hypothetical protein